MKIDRICFYVEDAKQWRDWFVRVMGFEAIASSADSQTQTEILRSGAIAFSLSSPLTASSPVAIYLQDHPPGVADLVFSTPHLEAILAKVKQYGGTILEPLPRSGERRYCKIIGTMGLTHTLIEDREETYPTESHGCLFTDIDHIVLNVARDKLEETVHWYEAVFGFQRRQTFTIQTPRSGLYSQVMVHPESGIKLPVNEPTSPNSQIQEFLEENNGAGVQHIALKSPQIIAAIARLREAGVQFLEVPPTYYRQLRQRYPNLNLSLEEWDAIACQQILVDCQFPSQKNSPLLLQIFTQPIFSKPTFFFEFIERRQQARGFGEGNFRALFEAMEREQMERNSNQ